MKKSYVLILSVLIGTLGWAQDEEVKRPDNIKVTEYDNFKNTSFDVLDQSNKLKTDLNVIDKDVKNYSGVIKTVEKQTLFKDLKALKGVKDSGEALSSQIGNLDNQSKDMLSNAKKAGLKAPAATKNTNTSVKALDKSKANLTAIKDLASSNIKLIQDELKARGEPIE